MSSGSNSLLFLLNFTTGKPTTSKTNHDMTFESHLPNFASHRTSNEISRLKRVFGLRVLAIRDIRNMTTKCLLTRRQIWVDYDYIADTRRMLSDPNAYEAQFIKNTMRAYYLLYKKLKPRYRQETWWWRFAAPHLDYISLKEQYKRRLLKRAVYKSMNSRIEFRKHVIQDEAFNIPRFARGYMRLKQRARNQTDQRNSIVRYKPGAKGMRPAAEDGSREIVPREPTHMRNTFIAEEGEWKEEPFNQASNSPDLSE